MLVENDGSGGFTARYTLITGGTSMPISYREIFKDSTQGIGSVGGRGTAVIGLDVPTRGSGASATRGVGDTQGSGAAITGNPGTGLSTTKPLMTPGNQTVIAAINECVFNEFGFTPEMAGRFKAAGQMLSGFTETSRHIGNDGFGIFQLKSGVRGDDIASGAFGIGDSTNITDQIGASADYFSGLTEKYKGNLDDAMAEFSLGPEQIKNSDIRKEWDEGWGAVNKELGNAWDQLSQSLQDGWDVLFPGETTPIDTEIASSSDEAREAAAAAEEEGAIASDPGFQSTVGVLVFDNEAEKLALSELRNSAEVKQKEAEEKARLEPESRGRIVVATPDLAHDKSMREAYPDATDEELGIGDFSPNVAITIF
jgi:hypothetical protein